MHQQFIGHHAPVDFELVELHAGIFVHGLHNITCLIGGCFQDRPGDVTLVDIAGKSHEHATRIGTPVWGEKTGEGRDKISAAIVFDRFGQTFDFRRTGNQAQIVPQPLHQSAGYGNGSF